MDLPSPTIVAIGQMECFAAAFEGTPAVFARTEGIVPAPEPTHALAAAIREALACNPSRESGESKTILTALCGHGHLDLAAYEDFLSGAITDLDLSDEALPSGPVDAGRSHAGLNDEMSENFADAILSYSPQWAQTAGVSDVRFTYGTLYGTPRNSNKKDWHILRNLVEKASAYSATVQTDARNRWYCRVKLGRITVTTTVRIGTDWWEHLGGRTCA